MNFKKAKNFSIIIFTILCIFSFGNSFLAIIHGQLFIKTNYYLFYTLIGVVGTIILFPKLSKNIEKKTQETHRSFIRGNLELAVALSMVFYFLRLSLFSIIFLFQLYFTKGSNLEPCYRKILYQDKSKYSKTPTYMVEIKSPYKPENSNQLISFPDYGYRKKHTNKDSIYIKLDYVTFYFGAIHLQKATILRKHEMPNYANLDKSCFSLN